MKFCIATLGVLLLLSCTENDSGSSSATEESSVLEAVEIQDRGSALDFLRSIGFSVFTEDDAVNAPNFEALLLSGETISLADYKGDVVLINFWATWCGPCKFELPTLQSLYVDLQNENFVFLAVNQQENADIVQEYISAENYSFPVVLDSDGIINYQYGVRGLPTTYIVGTDGRVLAGKVGTHLFDGEVYRDLFRNLM